MLVLYGSEEGLLKESILILLHISVLSIPPKCIARRVSVCLV